MLSNRLILSLVLVGLIAAVSEAKKDHDEECSTLSQLTNIFTSEKNDDPEGCDTEKGLICLASKCVCANPVTVYQKGMLFGLFGGGRCVGMANSPCIGKESACVSDSTCGSETVSLCICNEGYHSKDGRCTSAAVQLGGTSVLYLFGLILSYIVMGQ